MLFEVARHSYFDVLKEKCMELLELVCDATDQFYTS